MLWERLPTHSVSEQTQNFSVASWGGDLTQTGTQLATQRMPRAWGFADRSRFADMHPFDPSSPEMPPDPTTPRVPNPQTHRNPAQYPHNLNLPVPRPPPDLRPGPPSMPLSDKASRTFFALTPRLFPTTLSARLRVRLFSHCSHQRQMLHVD